MSGKLEIEPISKKTLPEKIAERIRRLLEEGQLQPGSKLPGEREFAKMLNVGRSSLREALKGLSMLGILDHRPGDGTYLLDSPSARSIEPLSLFLTVQRGVIDEIIEAREILDIAIIGLAARRRGSGDLEALSAALKKMERSLEKPAEFYKHDLEFHLAYAKAAGNLVLSDLLAKIYRLYAEARDSIYQHADTARRDLGFDLEQHREMRRLIEEQDEAGAKKAMRGYLLRMRERHLVARDDPAEGGDGAG